MIKRVAVCERFDLAQLQRLRAAGAALMIPEGDRCPGCQEKWVTGHRMVIEDLEVPDEFSAEQQLGVEEPKKAITWTDHPPQFAKRRLSPNDIKYQPTQQEELAEQEEPPTNPFANDLSEAAEVSATVRKGDGGRNAASDVAGAFIDGWMHSRGWRFEPGKVRTYSNERAYELYPHPLNAMEEVRKIVYTINTGEAIVFGVKRLKAESLALRELAARHIAQIEQLEKPIPLILFCPMCHARHVDAGRLMRKPHRDHACQAEGCGHVWRPAIVPTVGVAHLPGYKDNCTCVFCGPDKHELTNLDVNNERCTCDCLAILHAPDGSECWQCPCTGYVRAGSTEGPAHAQ